MYILDWEETAENYWVTQEALSDNRYVVSLIFKEENLWISRIALAMDQTETSDKLRKLSFLSGGFRFFGASPSLEEVKERTRNHLIKDYKCKFFSRNIENLK